MPIIDTLATGKNIHQLCQKNHMKALDLADILGFTTPRAIFKWFNGTNLPTLDNLVILAGLFKVTVDDILVIKIQ